MVSGLEWKVKANVIKWKWKTEKVMEIGTLDYKIWVQITFFPKPLYDFILISFFPPAISIMSIKN